MKTPILAALAAALALPVVAQQETKPVEPRTQAVTTPASPKATDKATTPRENARIAKAHNKDAKCASKEAGKEKTQRQKKATAT